MTPEIRHKLKELRIKYEGFRSHIYKDSEGFNTIGYGTNLDVGISEKQASSLMDTKDEENEYKLFHYHPFFKDLNEARQMVLIDMCYNLGIEGFLKFHGMLLALQSHNYPLAHDEMLNSKWAQQVGNRALTLAKIMLTGEI